MTLQRLIVTIAAAVACGCAADGERAARRFTERGAGYARAERYEAAAIEYRNAIKQLPGSAEMHKELAGIQAHLGNADATYRSYREACLLAPADRDACLEAARLLLAAGQFTEAERQARAVIERAPHHVEAQVVLASAAFGRGRLKEAAEILEAAIAIEPRPEPFAALGEVRLAAGDVAGAEEAFRAGVERSSGAPDARVNLARFLTEQGDIAEAEAELLEATRTAPDHELANRALASLYISTDRAAEAESYLTRAAVHRSSSHRSLLALADFYAGAGRWEEARTVLDRAPLEGVIATAARVRLAAIQYEQGLTDVAHRILDGVLDRKATADAWTLQAHFLARERQFDAAAKAARRALALEPGSSDAHRIVAVVERERGNIREAEEALRAAERGR